MLQHTSKTNQKPVRVTVVIPTYNRAALIGMTLDAVIAQTTPATEVIVVDDGSTDATQEVLQGYAPYVRVITVSNGGDLAARNIGVLAAVGDLVAFCDSDDLWRPGFLEAMTSLWHRDPNLLAAYCDFQIVRDGVWSERSKLQDAPGKFWEGFCSFGDEAGMFDSSIVERLLHFQPLFPSAMVVRRDLFLRSGGWDEGVSRVVGTDFATALRMGEYSLGIVLTPLVGIRKHDNNFSGNLRKTILGETQILEYVLLNRPSLAPYHSAIVATIAERRGVAADLAFDDRDFASVCGIQKLLPPNYRPLRRRMKAWISHLPPPVARKVAAFATYLIA